MRKDLMGIYQMMSKVKNLSQDRKEFMGSGLPNIQDVTFTEDPLGGYTIPTPIHEEEPVVKKEETKKEEDPKLKTKAEQDEEDKRKAKDKKFEKDLAENLEETLDMPDRFL
jgi:hypothetical protein